MVRILATWLCGDRHICSMVRVPTVEEEYAKRPHRERERLVQDNSARRGSSTRRWTGSPSTFGSRRNSRRPSRAATSHPRQSRCAQERQGRQDLEEKGGWFLFLLPFSPDLNPIEMAFSKLKAHLRAAGARTFDALWRAVGSICDPFSQQECWNYFVTAGYAYD